MTQDRGSSVTGQGVERSLDVAGGSTSSTVMSDLPPTVTLRITVTSVGADGDGGVSGVFRLAASGPTTTSELTIDFTDPGPNGTVAASSTGAGPWVNPELSWTPSAGREPKGYLVRVTGEGGAVVVEKTLPGSATTTRLGDAIAAGIPHTVSLTPVLADGADGTTSRLIFGNSQAPRPEEVTGNAPVIQFSPVTSVEVGRVLGYEIAFGAGQTSRHVFVAAPSEAGPADPWVAVDPSFAAVDETEKALPMKKMVAIVRTITTMGKSAWTPARTITYSDVATADAAYFAGIGHLGGGDETVPRHGFLNVHGAAVDVQVTDLVWAQSRRQQTVPVTLSVFGSYGAPALTQDVPATHLPAGAEDAWRASDIPLPDGWTSIVLRRGGTDVVRWVNWGGRACVATVTFADAPTDLPEMWKDSWCPNAQ